MDLTRKVNWSAHDGDPGKESCLNAIGYAWKPSSRLQLNLFPENLQTLYQRISQVRGDIETVGRIAGKELPGPNCREIKVQ